MAGPIKIVTGAETRADPPQRRGVSATETWGSPIETQSFGTEALSFGTEAQSFSTEAQS
jgi:hypothetical protein